MPLELSQWVSSLLSVEAADRPAAESALCEIYGAAGIPHPRYFFWFDSPFDAAWAVKLLKAPVDSLTQSIVESTSRTRTGREQLERVQGAMCESAQSNWSELSSTTGIYLRQNPRRPSLDMSLFMVRSSIYPSGYDLYRPCNDAVEAERIEQRFREVLGHQANRDCYANTTIESCFYHDYWFYQMAADEEQCRGGDVPRLLSAIWTLAPKVGLWWPFLNAVVLLDHPAKILLNERMHLHCADGPAITYRDGTPMWAWDGFPMCEEWILHPGEIDKRTLQCFDESFQSHAKRLQSMKPAAKVKPSRVLKLDLPADRTERVKVLRAHNQGRLPLLDRYLSGDIKVWDELIALGHSVRGDPYAADALAVAYEIMERVRENVRTVTARLLELGFEKTDGALYTPPGVKTRKQIARLEESAGALPLSLRAFYDVVGGVDWTGHHQSIAPRGASIVPDPLMVFPVEVALQASGEAAEEGIIIAPDEIFKAGDGGGDAYLIEAPNWGADGKLVNECHNLHFVDYLRLAFRFGGFPGYDGVEDVPPELAELSRGLLPF